MKNSNCFRILLLGVVLILFGEVHAQVQTNGPTTSAIKNQNPFFDASTNFNASTNKGKGLVFPQTNLTTFTFIITALDEITFPTAFNGLIVYNTGTGNTLTTGSNPKTSTAVTPGFYYFSNPNATKSVINGRWVRMNDNMVTTIPQGNALPATGNKIGDIFYLVGTGLQVYDGTAWTGVGGSVSGLGTAAYLNAGTSANNVVQLDANGKLPAIDGSQLTNLVSAPVTSVAGQTGAITLAMMGLENVNNTSDANKPVSTATQTALNAKMTIATYDTNTDGVVDAAATATSATTATNLAGGVAGGVVYQSAAGTSAVTAAGTAGYLLKSNGAAAPTWVAAPSLGTAAALNVGTSANNVVQLDANGKLPAINGSLLTNLPAAPVTSVAGQTGVVTLAGMGLGNVNNTSDANKPVSTATQTALNAKMTITTYDSNSDGVVNAAVTATNLAGGVAGGVVYQSAAGTSAVTAAGTAGYLLQSNGAAAPTWVAGLTNSLAQGRIWIGNSSGIATAVDARGSGQILIGDGTTIASKAVSGDVALTSTGAVTVNKIKNIPLDFTTAPTNGQVLTYDATNTKWIPGSVSATDEKVKVNGGTNALPLSSTDFYEGVSEITIKTSAVTSDKILDQAIMNADVNASAAIAGTKISPDFGSQNIRTTGYLQLGTPAGSNITASSGNLKVAGAAEIDGVLWTADLKTSSDERLKTNIATLTGVLEKINQLRGVSYVFKNQQKYATGPQVGVIAQELQKVYPELVAKGADGYLGVNYSQLTAVLIQAVKEQQVQINKLNERLDKQQQQIDLLFKTNGLKKN